MAYKGFTEAQAKAHKKYMKERATIQLYMEFDKREEIKARASDLGLSVNGYILRLIDGDLSGSTLPVGESGSVAGAGLP